MSRRETYASIDGILEEGALPTVEEIAVPAVASWVTERNQISAWSKQYLRLVRREDSPGGQNEGENGGGRVPLAGGDEGVDVPGDFEEDLHETLRVAGGAGTVIKFTEVSNMAGVAGGIEVLVKPILATCIQV